MPDVCMQTCERVACLPIPEASYESFEMFKISASETLTVSHCQSPSVVWPTTARVSVCVRPCLSISVTFRRYFFDMVTEGEIRYDSHGY